MKRTTTKPGAPRPATPNPDSYGGADSSSASRRQSADKAEFDIRCVPRLRGLSMLTALLGLEVVHTDTINLTRAEPRRKFARDLIRTAKKRFSMTISSEDIELKLMEHAAQVQATNEEEDEADRHEPVYAIVESEDSQQTGIFKEAGSKKTRLTNFTARVVEDAEFVDREPRMRRFRGVTFHNGRDGAFDLSSDDWANTDRFRAAMYAAAGSTATFLVDRIPEVRVAIALTSTPIQRAITKEQGWSEDHLQYLTPNGIVEKGGFREYAPEDPIRVEVSENEDARPLGLSRLEPNELAEGRLLIVEHFLHLHDFWAMLGLLGAAALAVLEPFAGTAPRPSIWIKGDSGVGKSFAANLTQGFFGDFRPRSKRRRTSWTSSTDRIEKAGSCFRNALFVVDGFKPEDIDVAVVSKVVQIHCDEHAQGLLMSTCEAIPPTSLASIARIVLIDMPARDDEASNGHAEACETGRHLLRGVMADFIAWTIRKRRTTTFRELVAEYRERFMEGVAGRQNADRIAGNHALLAAGVAEFANYLGSDRVRASGTDREQILQAGVWPDWRAHVEKYVVQGLFPARDRMLNLVEELRASQVFGRTLPL